MVNCSFCGVEVSRRISFAGQMVCKKCKQNLLLEALEKSISTEIASAFSNVSVSGFTNLKEDRMFLKFSYKDGKRKVVRITNPLPGDPVFLCTKVSGSDQLDKSYGSLPYFLMKAMGDRGYDVYTLNTERPWVPEMPNQDWLNTSPQDREFLFETLKDRIVGLFESKGSLKFAMTKEGSVDFLEPFCRLGFVMNTGAKPDKRFVKLLNSFTLFDELSPELRVKVIETEDRDLDGMTGINPRLVASAINNSWLTVSSHGDDASADSIVRRAASTCVFNGVIFMPGMGMIKGQIAVLPANSEWDIVTTRANIKKELSLSESSPCGYLAMDPSPGKDKAYLNKQATPFNPKIFGIDIHGDLSQSPVVQWANDHIRESEESLRNGQVEETCDELLTDLNEGRIEASQTTQNRLWLAQWYEAFGHVKSMPELLRIVTKSHYDGIVDRRERSVRVRIPNAKYVLVVSDSCMRKILGVDVTVRPGTAIYLEKFKFLVVSAKDFNKNYLNHGGNDLDDKFCVMWRIHKGRIVVILHRNPSDVGEYAMYEFVGDLPRGIKPTMPIVDELPQQLTQMAEPFKLPKAEACKVEPYAWIHAQAKVISKSINPGTVVNCITLWNTTYPETRNHHLPYMEDCIDHLTSAKSRVLSETILAQAKKLVAAVAEDSAVKVDREVWNGVRGLFPKLVFDAITSKIEAEGRFEKCWYTRILDLVEVKVKEAATRLIQILEEDRRYVDFGGITHQVPKKAVDMVRDRLMAIKRLHAFSDDEKVNGKVTQKGWDRVAQGVSRQLLELKGQFELWGLDPETDLFATIGKVSNDLPVGSGYAVIKKDIFPSLFEAALKANGKA